MLARPRAAVCAVVRRPYYSTAVEESERVALSRSVSRIDRLQALAGGRGTISYVSTATFRQRADGWYFTPTVSHDGCECEVCEAHHAGRAVYIGRESALAAAVLGGYITTHEQTG